MNTDLRYKKGDIVLAERREEKYLITLSEYSKISSRLKQLLTPDKNGVDGKYSICSLYFDDPFDTALLEKEDGNPVHIKFRIRTYNGEKKIIKLERKTKRGIVTEKHSATITKEELDKILSNESIDENSECFGLVSEMRTKAFRPVVSVKYNREAYVMPSLGIRVTFDTMIDSLPPEKDSLFGANLPVRPSLPRNEVIMEIKYSQRCPAFIRRSCKAFGLQLSVSKYALCRKGELK